MVSGLVERCWFICIMSQLIRLSCFGWSSGNFVRSTFEKKLKLMKLILIYYLIGSFGMSQITPDA